MHVGQPVVQRRPPGGPNDVRNRDRGEERAGPGARQEPEDEGAGDQGRSERDGSFDRQLPAADRHGPGQHRREADHRGEVEDVGAEDDSEADVLLAARQRDDCRRELWRIGGECGEEPDHRLGQAEPRADVVEPVGEEARRRQRQRERADEERDGERRGQRFTDSLLFRD